jgi:hypothetical protein
LFIIRGLLPVEGAYVAVVMKLMEYVQSKEDPMMQIVKTCLHDTDSAVFPTGNKFKKYFHNETKQIKDVFLQNIMEKWEHKRMQGQFPRSLDIKLVDREHSYQWPKFIGRSESVKGRNRKYDSDSSGSGIQYNLF